MAKATASLSITIDRPVSEVFAFMVDYRNNPRWQEGLESVEQADVPPKLGSRISTTRRLMGRSSTSTVEVTAFEADRTIRSRSVSGPVDYEGGYDYAPAGDSSTRVTYQGVITTGRFMGPVGKLMARGFQKQMEANLERLKKLLQS